MVQLRVVLLFSSVLLFCSGFGEAKLPELIPNDTTVLERFTGNYGYYILPIDRTTFSVDHAVWLMQFDISKVFGYHPTSKTNINNVLAKVRLYEINKKDGNDDNDETVEEKKEIFFGQISLNSEHEAIVKMPRDILLKTGYEYQIQVETPEDTHLMINETFTMRTMKIHRPLAKSIQVKFHQSNPNVKPPFDEATKRKPSNGLVRRIHLKYKTY